MQLFKQRK